MASFIPVNQTYSSGHMSHNPPKHNGKPLSVHDKFDTHDPYCNLSSKCIQGNFKCVQAPGHTQRWNYVCPNCKGAWWPMNVEWRPRTGVKAIRNFDDEDIGTTVPKKKKEVDYLDLNRMFSR